VRIGCLGFCLRVSGGVCFFPMSGMLVLRLTCCQLLFLGGPAHVGSGWIRWCCRGPYADRMGPTSRLMFAVRSPATVCGKKLQWWEPAGSRRRLCGWSWNSFFRESAEVFRGPEGAKATSILPNQGLGRPKSCSRAQVRSFRAFGKVGWLRRVKLSHFSRTRVRLFARARAVTIGRIGALLGP
jgi:hypothetical protein